MDDFQKALMLADIEKAPTKKALKNFESKVLNTLVHTFPYSRAVSSKVTVTDDAINCIECLLAINAKNPIIFNTINHIGTAVGALTKEQVVRYSRVINEETLTTLEFKQSHITKLNKIIDERIHPSLKLHMLKIVQEADYAS